MSGRTQRIEVQDSTGAVRGHVHRHIRSGLWRASGKPPPAVWLGGAQLQPSVRGRGAEAELFVRLPEGAALPKELEASK
jgi:hypothetical protein